MSGLKQERVHALLDGGLDLIRFPLVEITFNPFVIAFSPLYRRQKARLGPAQAVVATAHAIARVVYKMLKYKVEYEPLSVSEYEKRYRDGQVKYLHKKAEKLGFQLVPT